MTITNTRIVQVSLDTTVLPSQCRGKWYCSVYDNGSDGWPIYRYLQADGSWGKTTHYFDTQEILAEAALTGTLRGEIPDFFLSNQELQDRAEIREMAEESFRDDFDAGWDRRVGEPDEW